MSSPDNSNKTREQLVAEINALRQRVDELTKVQADYATAIKSLSESESRLSDAQRIGKMGSFTFDLTTGFWSGTDMLYPILGIKKKREYTLEDWVEILHPDHRDKLATYQKTILDKKIPFDKDYLIVRQTDGEARWVHSFGELQFDDSGNVVGMIGTTRDITESKQAEEALQNAKNDLEASVEKRTRELSIAKQEAEVASKAKSEFLSSMSHELRTPMSAILGFARLLESDEGSLSESQLSSVKDIIAGGNHLLELINEVLDLATIEAGKLNIVIEDVSLPMIIDECCCLTSGLVKKAGIVIDFGRPEYIVQADWTRLKQVLINFISNAIKYNRPDGKIKFAYEPLEENRLKISVTDTGFGLNDAQVSKLFIAFERVGAESSTIEGAGIGLALCKRYVELMGGTVGVSSQKGKGSTFWLELNYKEHEDLAEKPKI